eukprot:TRINITY_DN22679_c0_g1_i1.p1 TRINITY_DN22679_c0_g1~~TRINITY_DN22679_c0_g1_i1.p1  ORF type:complete len:467 (+),score=57.06 TRINITY_DN22679_c0_g1_i1:65-1402(+)
MTVANVDVGSGLGTHFVDPEDFVSFMQDSMRVVRLEWRKVRRAESRGLTSHSWLEARMLDGKRLRIEVYADRGFSDLEFDPTHTGIESAAIRGRFFESESKIYDNRVAETADFCQPLTAKKLKEIGAELCDSRPYSISEFNCHHFVLEVWNRVVIKPLRATHYPDRTKTGLLWGLEGTLTSWLGSVAGSVSGPEEYPPAEDDDPPLFGRKALERAIPEPPLSARPEVSSGSIAVANRLCPAYKREIRVEAFGHFLDRGCVYVLSGQGPLVPTGAPPPHPQHKEGCSAWAAAWLPNVLAEEGLAVAERINQIDVQEVVSKLFAATPSAGGILETVGSISFRRRETLISRAPVVADVCFVVLPRNTYDVRVAVYAVLRTGDGTLGCTWLLKMLGGNVYVRAEANYDYVLEETDGCQSYGAAAQVAREDCGLLQRGLATDDWSMFATL